jgi:hypothetical protein
MIRYTQSIWHQQLQNSKQHKPIKTNKEKTMPIIQVNEKDILRSTIVEPAWYEVLIGNIGEKLSKDGGSTNYPFEYTIVKNADTGDTKFAGVPLEGQFNSKAIGFALGLLKALGEEIVPGRFNLSNAEGKRVEVFVKNGEWQGRQKNDVTDQYRMLREDRERLAATV